MSQLSELIKTAVEENWCTSTTCGICANQGFRLRIRERPREDVISDLRELPEEICDRHPDILRTVFADISIFPTGTELLEQLENTPAGAVLETAILYAKAREDRWRAYKEFCSPEAAKERAEARKKESVKNQNIRRERKAELDSKLSEFRYLIDGLDLDNLFESLRRTEDLSVVRAVGGLAYPVLRELIRFGELNRTDIDFLESCASNFGGYWAKLMSRHSEPNWM